jgi:hypothetical protein
LAKRGRFAGAYYILVGDIYIYIPKIGSTQQFFLSFV